MPVALCTMSHSPLIGKNDPEAAVVSEVQAAFASARAFIDEFDPELVIIFAPDHYNGVFYDMLPPFCVGAAAEAVGDFDTPSGPLNVDRDAAHHVARSVLESGIDVAISERMHVDHGFSQALELLTGSLSNRQTVPIFINCVGEPLGPVARVRLLGEAVGRAALELDKRVLLIGSGGLSHDPPVPQFQNAPHDVRERLIDGRDPTPAQREARIRNVVNVAQDFTAGIATIQPLNPTWDQHLLDVIGSGDLEQVDAWSNDWFVENAGHSSHEVRTWIAAFAALSAAGAYDIRSSYYRAIPEWIAGFAIATAVPSRL